MAALALLSALIVWDGLSEVWRGVNAGGSRVVMPTGAGAGMAVASMLGAVAAMLLQTSSSERRTRALFRVALVALPFVVLLPLALLLLTPLPLEARGYQRCTDATDTQRFLACIGAA